MPRIIVTDSGAVEREVSRLFVVDSGGTTRLLSRAFVVDSGGTSRQIWPAVVFTLSGFLGTTTDGASPYNTTNAIRVGSDGNLYEGDSVDGAALSFAQVNTTNNWIRPVTDATNYFVRYSNVVGTFTSTPGAVNTAIALTSDRTWSLNSTTADITEVTFDLEILDTDGTTVLAGPSAHRVRCTNIS